MGVWTVCLSFCVTMGLVGWLVRWVEEVERIYNQAGIERRDLSR